MPGDLDQRVLDVFRRVFPGAQSLSVDAVDTDLRRGVLEEWDSLGHLQLIATLTEEFSVPITPEQALELESVEDVKRFIREAAVA